MRTWGGREAWNGMVGGGGAWGGGGSGGISIPRESLYEQYARCCRHKNDQMKGEGGGVGGEGGGGVGGEGRGLKGCNELCSIKGVDG